MVGYKIYFKWGTKRLGPLSVAWVCLEGRTKSGATGARTGLTCRVHLGYDATWAVQKET